MTQSLSLVLLLPSDFFWLLMPGIDLTPEAKETFIGLLVGRILEAHEIRLQVWSRERGTTEVPSPPDVSPLCLVVWLDFSPRGRAHGHYA